MPSSIVFNESICPACLSGYCVKAARFPFNDFRSPDFSDLFICIQCKSSHFLHEPRSDSSLDWHKKVLLRNKEWSAELFHAIQKRYEFHKVLDIGCGIGTWLNVANTLGCQVLGYDTAAECVDYGKSKFNIELICDYFFASHFKALEFNADLITCIMVFEHLNNPSILAEEIASYCIKNNAVAYISVPFFNELDYLNFDATSNDYNVFNDVGAHVTYFSDLGLCALFERYGLRTIDVINDSNTAWRGFLFGAKNSSNNFPISEPKT